MAKLKLGVQISGRGSNLQALIDACAQPDFPAEIALVISNIPDVYGLERARKEGIATQTIPHKNFKGRADFEAALDDAHRAAGVQLICLAGFMRVITPWFIERWRGRFINIHPSLLPAFPGLHTHARVLEAGLKFTGCTVHYVEAEVDAGAVIVQAAVPVMPDDDEEALATRVLSFEHQAYPLAVRLIAEGRVRYDNGKAIHEGIRGPDSLGLLNPSGSRVES